MKSEMMTLLVVGATGPTGIEICRQALHAGIRVRVLARSPERIPADLRGQIEIVRGNVLDVASLVEAATGTNAVVSALGTPLQRKPVSLLSQGTQNLLRAMQQAQVSRFLCITGMGAGDSRGHGGFLYDRIILPLLLREIYLDKDRQEQIVRASPLDWTLIRPAFLTNGPATGRYRCITRFDACDRMGKISRADVAHFVVQELFQRNHIGATANLTY